jgi:5-methylcytosine-specific restriction endonuclease McrA
MQRVFVLDKHKNPLMPTTPKRARQLIAEGRARIVKLYPFTIVLIDRVDGDTQKVEWKCDPGSKESGIALVAHFPEQGKVVLWAGVIRHRGEQIKEALRQRRQVRRNRRSRKTRYREPRFDNRKRDEGWLPPSLKSRVENIKSWINKIIDLCPIEKLTAEIVRFDTQKMRNQNIEGIEYQQGKLQGYEVKEYLLDIWGRNCVYCGQTDVPLEAEHIIPKSRGGTDRVDNLTISCIDCNQEKGSQTAKEFGYPDIQDKVKYTLKDVSAVNSTKEYLKDILTNFDKDVEFASAGQTKYNRSTQDYLKTHCIDASCVGDSGENVTIKGKLQPLKIIAKGRGSRQMCRVDKHGFPRTKPKQQKRVDGFQTGDMVKAVVPNKYKTGGTYIGRVSVRSSGSFNIKTASGTVRGVNSKYCSLLQRNNGYQFQSKEA